ncbi:hypothetical protein P4O66_003175 [Electrophorus voltai]|uniref:Uncharacterized protein n=1 Tax=Electrophorus voltai TaxID=2609070 RepID=A0AAD8YTS5_9TELE|nr:hypothetical protein P4O66_003175 [Electrophorus voltai]
MFTIPRIWPVSVPGVENTACPVPMPKHLDLSDLPLLITPELSDRLWAIASALLDHQPGSVPSVKPVPVSGAEVIALPVLVPGAKDATQPDPVPGMEDAALSYANDAVQKLPEAQRTDSINMDNQKRRPMIPSPLTDAVPLNTPPLPLDMDSDMVYQLSSVFVTTARLCILPLPPRHNYLDIRSCRNN